MTAINPEPVLTVKVSTPQFEDFFENFAERVHEDIAEFEPLEEDPEITEEDLQVYINDINTIFADCLLSTRSLHECQMLQRALENLLEHNFQNLLESANQAPEKIQSSIERIADRLISPQNYVGYPSHSHSYIELVKETIGLELSKLSIFANKLVEKERNAEAMQKSLQEVRAQQEMSGNLTAVSTEDIIQASFWFGIEAASRPNLSIQNYRELMPIMQKIRDAGITKDQLLSLTESELNSVIFHGASQEAWDIIENLAATNAARLQGGFRY